MAPGALAQVLRKIPNLPNENLLVGYDTSDDACVYRISDELALVQTVDFFPPMVDDPFQFGQIAAANALSDIYAMGGRPTHAMNLLCFPECLDLEIAAEILAGGADKVREAGCTIAGGHSINDKEPKYGLCVSGFVDPRKMLTNSAVKPGDCLVITKPIGTGILTTAAKGELLTPEETRGMVDTMRTLNRVASMCAEGVNVHACTDITGFGLAGHLCEMAEGSKTSIFLEAGKVPVLPGVLQWARMGMIPAGAYRNRKYFGPRVKVAESVPTELSDAVFDPQTSGGLLFSLPEQEAKDLLARLQDANVPAAIIGYASTFDGTSVHVV